MERKIVLADTSVLIDFFRKKDKTGSRLVQLVNDRYHYCISSITTFEIYTGATPEQLAYWNQFLKRTHVLDFDRYTARTAAELQQQLKRKRKLIAIPDLLIASTAMAHHLPIATLNTKHFNRIDGLRIVA